MALHLRKGCQPVYCVHFEQINIFSRQSQGICGSCDSECDNSMFKLPARITQVTTQNKCFAFGKLLESGLTTIFPLAILTFKRCKKTSTLKKVNPVGTRLTEQDLNVLVNLE